MIVTGYSVQQIASDSDSKVSIIVRGSSSAERKSSISVKGFRGSNIIRRMFSVVDRG